MQTSESITNIIPALIALQGKLEVLKEDGHNPHHHSTFASLTAIWSAIRPLLAEHKLAIVQLPTTNPDETWLRIQTTLYHESTEWLQDSFVMPLAKEDPQGVGSAITYGRRYGICALLGIVTAGEDNDGQDHRDNYDNRSRNRDSGNRANSRPSERPRGQARGSEPPRGGSFTRPPQDAAAGANNPTQGGPPLVSDEERYTERIEDLRAEIRGLGGDPGNDPLAGLTLDELKEIGSATSDQLKRLKDTKAKEAEAKTAKKGEAAPPSRGRSRPKGEH